MNAINKISDTDRYARCIQTSKRVRWDIDEDIIRGRTLRYRPTSSFRTGFHSPMRSQPYRPTKSGS